ncbi:DNA helicase [Bombiscardovia nodaiensis]|uniref:DNA helicase n=1 Tax=Bombiscardovia nodaiensis TaxID=2932181 RepID=A0ABM8B9L5_9BIFI|nr:DNA helicase [Bombiscardovia nodaiensis]
MSTYSSQLHEEQGAVDRAYGRLDSLRTQTKSRLDAVRAAGSHGSPTQRTERDSFANMYEDRLAQLRAVEDRLVFGRLDQSDGERRYIGRIGLSSEAHEPILTDWRAEAARPFYEATPSHHGNIALRRHITLSFRTVTGIEDEVLDVHSREVDQAASQGTLAGEGALLASLSSRRTGKMTDIVATIQAEQDRIIRADLGHAVVVQGGPGTGKTAVALHRAAYLLYTHRATLERSGVLVVGPSSTFLRYIDQVLPSLGETGVLSRTIGDLIPGYEATASESAYVARLKGDKRMAALIASAVHSRERVPSELPAVSVEGVRVPMLAVDLEQALSDAHRTRQPHNKARETFARAVLQAMVNRYAERVDYEPEADELSRVKALLRMNDQVRKTINLAWLPMKADWLLDNLWSHPALITRLAPWLSPEQVQSLVRPKGSPLTVSDIPLLDEAMELLGPDPKEMARQAAQEARQAQERQFAQDTLAQNGIGTGLVTSQMLLDNINGLDTQAVAQRAAEDREWAFGHIVVDEAQELTAMDWRMLVRRCPSRSFTIVGDVAQTSALGGTRSWQQTMDQLFGPDGWDLNELTIDYRNPQEVSQLAARFAQAQGLHVSTLKAVRAVPGAVERIRVSSPEECLEAASQAAARLAHKFVSPDGTGRVAVITAADQVTALKAAVGKAYRQAAGGSAADRLASQSQWDRQLIVTATDGTKGLEFDAVVLVDPQRIADSAPSRLVAASDLYVAMTRPTQQLVIVEQADDGANATWDK